MSEKQEKKKRRIAGQANARIQANEPSQVSQRQTDDRKTSSTFPFSFSSSLPASHLAIALSAAVPLRVLGWYERGDIEPWQFEGARAFGHVLATKGDVLLFRSKKEGETARLFNGLAKALSLMAFSPGGVTAFGHLFDARKILTSSYGEETAQAFCQTMTQHYYEAVVTELHAYGQTSDAAPLLGPYNVIRWFEQAPDETLLHLWSDLGEYHASSDWYPIAQPTFADQMIEEMLRQAHKVVAQDASSPEAAQCRIQAQMLIDAQAGQHPITCLLAVAPVKRWLLLYRHGLVTGSSWEQA